MARKVVTVLAIGGTDPLSGAGVVADALTLAEHGIVPLTATTAFVDQDSRGVRGFALSPEPWFSRGLEAALDDGRPSAVKVGMLGAPERAHRVASTLVSRLSESPTWVVLDPVLAGGHDGSPLAAEAMPDALRRFASALAVGHRLVITPNTHELAALLGDEDTADDIDQLERQALRLSRTLNVHVLAKGGHLKRPGADCLAFRDLATHLPALDWPREGDIHGTGCRLSSALAARLALGDPLETAVVDARAYLSRSALERTARVGVGRRQFVPALALGVGGRGDTGQRSS